MRSQGTPKATGAGPAAAAGSTGANAVVGPNQQYLFSTIFEKEEDIKDNPFEFDKKSIGPRKEAYPNMKFEGPLFKKGKESELELKERFFIYHDNNLVSFKVKIIFDYTLNRIRKTLKREASSILSMHG